MDKKKKLPYAVLFLGKSAFIIVAIVLCWNLLMCPFYVSGNSMFPAVRDGDLCFIYRLGNYYTGNIVVYLDGNGNKKIGRIAGTEGAEVDFPESGGYTVNGYQPSESVTYQTFRAEGSAVEYPLTVPEGSFFILNDFRSDTSDSRKTGCVAEKNIIGQVVFLVRRRGF